MTPSLTKVGRIPGLVVKDVNRSKLARSLRDCSTIDTSKPSDELVVGDAHVFHLTMNNDDN